MMGYDIHKLTSMSFNNFKYIYNIKLYAHMTL